MPITCMVAQVKPGIHAGLLCILLLGIRFYFTLRQDLATESIRRTRHSAH